jgi:hypothetical protein
MNNRRLNMFAAWVILVCCLCALVYMVSHDLNNNNDGKASAGDVTGQPTALVVVDSTADVVAYYPQFSRIDLVCDTMPNQGDAMVIFCAEAAFTHELLEAFAHSNIDGDHVSGGSRYVGAQCKDNSGAFISWGNHWEFIQGDYSAALDQAAAKGGMGFGQASIIHQGKRVERLGRSGVNQYRALCEKEGQLCIVDSREAVEYAQFVDQLEGYGVTEALYLDMGAGWNHSWWRDVDDSVHEIHPCLDKSRDCTNWITFYR